MKLDGLAEVVKAMEAMGKDLKGDPLRASLRKGTAVILDQARLNAVFKKGFSEGRIQENIQMKPLPPDEIPSGFSDGQEVFVASSRKSDPDAPDNAWYWHFVEFGTKKQTAQPFLAPAFDAKRNDAIQTFADEMKKQVDRNARRIAKGQKT